MNCCGHYYLYIIYEKQFIYISFKCPLTYHTYYLPPPSVYFVCVYCIYNLDKFASYTYLYPNYVQSLNLPPIHTIQSSIHFCLYVKKCITDREYKRLVPVEAEKSSSNQEKGYMYGKRHQLIVFLCVFCVFVRIMPVSFFVHIYLCAVCSIVLLAYPFSTNQPTSS